MSSAAPAPALSRPSGVSRSRTSGSAYDGSHESISIRWLSASKIIGTSPLFLLAPVWPVGARCVSAGRRATPSRRPRCGRPRRHLDRPCGRAARLTRIRGAGSSRQEPSSDGRRRRGRRAGQRRLGLWTPRSPDEGRLPLGGPGLGVQGGSNLYWEAERWKSSPTRSFHLVSRRFGARDAPARAAAGRTFVQPGRCPMHGGCANRAGTAGTSNTDDSTQSTRSPAKGAAPGREVTASRSCKPASRVSAPTTWSVRSAERTGLERRESRRSMVFAEAPSGANAGSGN